MPPDKQATLALREKNVSESLWEQQIRLGTYEGVDVKPDLWTDWLIARFKTRNLPSQH